MARQSQPGIRLSLNRTYKHELYDGEAAEQCPVDVKDTTKAETATATALQ